GALSTGASAQQDFWAALETQFDTTRNPDIKEMVSRLKLENYKATIKGLTQFGDRRQGTKRNRDALDWIEAQLKSFGCTNTERITYAYTTPQRGGGRGGGRGGDSTAAGRGGAAGGRGAAGGGRGAAGRGGADSAGRGNAAGGGRGPRPNVYASG